MSINFVQSIFLPDNNKAFFGNSNDLQIYHDSSDSYMINQTGRLYIRQSVSGEDIDIQNKVGGTNTTYLKISGQFEHVQSNVNFKVPDSKFIQVGTSNDLQLTHNGTNSFIQTSNSTGDLYIRQQTSSKDILLQSDDGSGGVTTYLRLDGGDQIMKAGKNLRFNDEVKAVFGTNNDASIQFDANENFKLQTTTGDIIIQNTDNDKDIEFKCDDGLGGTTEYFRIDGGSVRNIFSQDVSLTDSVKLLIGSSSDLQLFHDGSNTLVENYVGNITFEQRTDEGEMIFKSDNGSGGTTTYFKLDGSVTQTIFEQNARFLDSVQLRFGTSNDLKIYHDGSNSFIEDAGTGDLYIDGTSNVFIRDKTSGNVWFQGNQGGVNLRYQDSIKITTTNTGVSVTGDVVGSGGATFTGNVVCNLEIEKTGSTDGSFQGDIVYWHSTTVSAGRVYCYKNGQWTQADMNAESTATGTLGIALGNGLSSSVGMLIRGTYTLVYDPGDDGDLLYLDASGLLTNEPPSGSGDVVRIVGQCLDSSNGNIFFNPDYTFITLS